jgi:uncharacterized membrane protein YsdA (DUF1294 family)
MENSLYLLGSILILVNFLSFIFVGLDKKKSLANLERTPEVRFFLFAALFGSLGIFFGIFVFRHKTRKIYFPLGIGLLLIQQIALLYLVSQSLILK